MNFYFSFDCVLGEGSGKSIATVSDFSTVIST